MWSDYFKNSTVIGIDIHKIDIKEISWYLLKTKYDGELIPEESEGISKCEWFDVDDFYLIKEECLPRIQYLVNFYTQLLRFDLI